MAIEQKDNAQGKFPEKKSFTRSKIKKKSPRFVILAGGGELPWLAAKNILARHEALRILCLTEEKPPAAFEPYCELVRITHFYTEILKKLRKYRTTKLLVLGKITRKIIYQNPSFDKKTYLLVKSMGGQSDYQLFLALSGLIEKEGIEIIKQNEYLPDYFLPMGRYGKELAPREIIDAALGLMISAKLNNLDIGQSVVVGQGAVLALEASEGTDACIRRGGEIYRHGAIVCKIAKTRHDLRFDMPTVGKSTLKIMGRIQARVLIVHGKRTIVIKPQDFVRLAESLNISILSVSSKSMKQDDLTEINRHRRKV